MNKFTLGALTGASSLALAVPLLATVSFAQSAPSASTEAAGRPVPSQACLLARVDLDSAHLANLDDNIAERKAHMQEQIDGLKEIAAITDETERAEALKQMHEERRASMQEDKPELPENIQAAMEKVKTECGDVMMFRGEHAGFPGRGKRVMKMRFGEDGPVRLQRFDIEAGEPVEIEESAVTDLQ